jgi:hypothetical protein
MGKKQQTHFYANFFIQYRRLVRLICKHKNEDAMIFILICIALQLLQAQTQSGAIYISGTIPTWLHMPGTCSPQTDSNCLLDSLPTYKPALLAGQPMFTFIPHNPRYRGLQIPVTVYKSSLTNYQLRLSPKCTAFNTHCIHSPQVVQLQLAANVSPNSLNAFNSVNGVNSSSQILPRWHAGVSYQAAVWALYSAIQYSPQQILSSQFSFLYFPSSHYHKHHVFTLQATLPWQQTVPQQTTLSYQYNWQAYKFINPPHSALARTEVPIGLSIHSYNHYPYTQPYFYANYANYANSINYANNVQNTSDTSLTNHLKRNTLPTMYKIAADIFAGLVYNWQSIHTGIQTTIHWAFLPVVPLPNPTPLTPPTQQLRTYTATLQFGYLSPKGHQWKLLPSVAFTQSKTHWNVSLQYSHNLATNTQKKPGLHHIYQQKYHTPSTPPYIFLDIVDTTAGIPFTQAQQLAQKQNVHLPTVEQWIEQASLEYAQSDTCPPPKAFWLQNGMYGGFGPQTPQSECNNPEYAIGSAQPSGHPKIHFRAVQYLSPQ